MTGGSVEIHNASDLTVNSLSMTGGTITSTGTGAGTLVLKGNVFTDSSSTSAIISAGINLDGGTRIFTIKNGNPAVDLELSGVLNLGGITHSGPGTLRLSGSAANTHLGTTTVSGGTLELNKTPGVNAIVSALTIGNGGVVRLLAGNQIASSSSVTINGGKLDLNGRSDAIGALTMNGGTVTTGGETLTLGGNLIANPGAFVAAQIDGFLDLGGITRTVTVAENASLAADAIIHARIFNGALTKLGAGTLTIDGSQNYSALVVTGGTVNLDTAVGTGASTVSVSPSAGTATVNFHADQTLASLTIGAGCVVTLSEENGSAFSAEDSVEVASFQTERNAFSDEGFALAAPAVPEPGALSLLASAALVLCGGGRTMHVRDLLLANHATPNEP